VALAGLGLLLLVGGTATAAESEHGDAEAAPVILAGETPEPTPEPRAVMSPARVVAHTAQLPKPSAKAGTTKPLFPAELPGARLRPPTGSRLPPGPAGPLAAPPAPGSGLAASPASGTPTRPKLTAAKGGASGPARRGHLPLAPNEAEIRREIATRNGGPALTGSPSPFGSAEAGKEKVSAAARLEEQGTKAAVQNRTWPTHVDYSAGPTGPAGGNTAGDRKGALIEATGPQQGVIRNRW